MITLSTLKDTTKVNKTGRRVGRGPGCKRGKTCGRGHKGAGSRSGYKTRAGREGGQFPLYMKSPIRGFTNTAFKRRLFALNFWQIEKFFNDGDLISEESLREKGILNGKWDGVKLLGSGELTKKVNFEVHAVSEAARSQVEKAGLTLSLV